MLPNELVAALSLATGYVCYRMREKGAIAGLIGSNMNMINKNKRRAFDVEGASLCLVVTAVSAHGGHAMLSLSYFFLRLP